MLTTPPEKTHLRLGFMPLNDCAPLIVAERLQLGAAYGLTLELARQSSWAAIRDKLLSGELDAAQALYSMVYGIELGIAGPQAAMAILLTLNQNGQGITLAPDIHAALLAGETLANILRQRPETAVFAHTFPTGTHALWLYDWLAAQGVDPFRDVRCIVIPPPEMPAALASGLLSGFCAGEPWHSVAEATGHGRLYRSTGELYPEHPEKVLACRADFVALYPHTAAALTATLLEACRWLDEPANRQQALGWLADEQAIAQPAERIAPRFLPQAHGVRFHAAGVVNYPYPADARWFLRQFQRWGMSAPLADSAAIIQRVQQTGLYQQVAQTLGIALQAGDAPAAWSADAARLNAPSFG